ALSDVYALGVIAYEMLTGRLPFNPDSPYQLLDMQRAGVQMLPIALRPDLPAAAQSVILKALSFNEADRHQRARDFGEELAQALTAPTSRVPDPIQTPTLEIAHVLFMDLVGYSKLPMGQQTQALHQLQTIVRETSTFRQAQAHHQLLSLPTGDGMALVFFGDP